MALTQISTDGIKNGTITGSDLATNVDLVDNQKLRLGTGNDLQIYHSGTNSFIDDQGTGNLYIKSNQFEVANANGLERMAKFIQDGAVELYYDNSKKFETQSTGAKVTGQLNFDDGSSTADTNGIGLGSSQDTRIFHDGSAFQIRNITGPISFITPSFFRLAADGSNDTMFKAIQDGAVELYHNNSKKFETRSGGAAVFGHLELGDNDKVMLGDSNDLQFFHDGVGSIIQNNTGPTIIRGAGSNVDIRNSNDEIMIRCNGGSSVDI